MDASDNDTASNHVLSLIDHAIPAFVRKGLARALERVCSDLWAIPSALLLSAAQRINDHKHGQSVFTSALATIASKNVADDNAIIQSTIDSYLPSTVRKTVNVAKVVALSVEKINDDISLTDKIEDDTIQPEAEDWLNSFYRYAEDASSERVQDMWARVLKGEIVNPGSVSKVTLRSLYELEQDVALTFVRVQENIICDGIYTHDLWRIFPEYTYAARQLLDAGLISSLPGYYFLHHEFNESGITIWPGEKLAMELRGPPNTSFKTGALPLTLAGRELRLLLNEEDKIDEMKRFHIVHSHFRRLFSEAGIYYIAVGELVTAGDGSQTIINAQQIGPSIHPKSQA